MGDSMMEGWNRRENIHIWNEYFMPMNAANFGMGGDTTHQTLWRIKNGELDYANPKLIVLLIGTNNISQEESPSNIALSIGEIISEIKNKCPATKILLLGVFPCGRKPKTPIRKKIVELNILLSALKTNTVFFRDLGDKFIDNDGAISRETMPDFLHLSTKGYLIWSLELNKEIKFLLID